jgi:DNA-binding transcriptional MocR family regulator
MNDPLITQTNLPPGFIDLGMGNPDLSLLPLQALQKSAESYFTKGDARSLQYGSEQGDGLFRRALANFLTVEYGLSTGPEQLFITTGASSALDLICTLYTNPGDTVFVEEPTYFLALRIFKDHGLRVFSVPTDTDGLRLDSLEEKLIKFHPKFVYSIPVFQNPTGQTLSLIRRKKLVELAQQHNLLIVADEVYQLLHYHQKPPKPLAAYSENVEQVISVNSFSKILAPGLRLGWIQAHPVILNRLTSTGLLDSGGGMNPFTSALVRELLESDGLAKNINLLRQEYGKRLDALDTALRRDLPAAEYVRPQGGFFFWVHLPGVDTAELRRKAQEFNVGLRQGELFSSRGEKQNFMRLGFCFYSAEEIVEGVKRIRDCLVK